MPWEDPENQKAAREAYRERNHEKHKAKNKAWYERNRERQKAKSTAWRKHNPERKRAMNKAWKERNPELKQEHYRQRRAKKKNAQVTLTANEKIKLLLLERTRSELQKETGRVYHLDHILPLAHGGLHHPLNLRILEDAENLSKHDKLLPEAIALAPEHFRLYNDRVSPERAWEFVRQLAAGLGINEEELDCLVEGTVPQIQESKSPLEDFME